MLRSSLVVARKLLANGPARLVRAMREGQFRGLDDKQRVILRERVVSATSASQESCSRAAELCAVAERAVFDARQEACVAHFIVYLHSTGIPLNVAERVTDRPRLILLPGGASRSDPGR